MDLAHEFEEALFLIRFKLSVLVQVDVIFVEMFVWQSVDHESVLDEAVVLVGLVLDLDFLENLTQTVGHQFPSMELLQLHFNDFLQLRAEFELGEGKLTQGFHVAEGLLELLSILEYGAHYLVVLVHVRNDEFLVEGLLEGGEEFSR